MSSEASRAADIDPNELHFANGQKFEEDNVYGLEIRYGERASKDFYIDINTGIIVDKQGVPINPRDYKSIYQLEDSY